MEQKLYFRPIEQAYSEGANLDVRARIALELAKSMLQSDIESSPDGIVTRANMIAAKFVTSWEQNGWVTEVLSTEEQLKLCANVDVQRQYFTQRAQAVGPSLVKAGGK